jgi:L-ribulose-5-phosphate 3-epimerase
MKYGTLQNVLQASLDDVFPLAARLGFDGVELDWNDPADAAPGGPLGPERREAIRTAAAQAGVVIPSVAAHFLNRGGLAQADEATRRAAADAVLVGIELCAELGARVLLVPFFGAAAIRGPEDIGRLSGHLRELAPIAERAGVILAVEHMLPAADTVALMDAVGSPAVATYWDMANGVALGYDPVADVRTLGRHIAQVHAKEYVSASGIVATPEAPRFDGLNARPFGQGDMPVRAVLKALNEVGYDEWVVLETGAFGDPPGAARAALAVLKELAA